MFWKILFWANVGARLFLLLFLALCLILPLSFEPPLVLNDVATQRVRDELIAKDVLLLKDDWQNSAERTQAISELQDSLPSWEKEQALLQKSTDSQVKLLMQQNQPDYTAIDVAAHAILAQDTAPADPIQVSIVLAHERPYLLSMGQMITYVIGAITAYDVQLFVSQIVSLFLLCVLTVAEQIIQHRHARRDRLQAQSTGK